MKNRLPGVLLYSSVLFFAGHLRATPIINLSLSGYAGDFLTHGQTWSVVYDTAADQIKAVAYGQSYYGLELDTFGPLSMSLVISAGGYGVPVTVGTYHAPGTGFGSDPEFAFGFDGRSDSDSQVDFTVNAIKTAPPPNNPPLYLPYQYPLEYLDVTFSEESWQGSPEFSGRIVFDANPVPEPPTLSLCALVAIGFVVGAFFRRSIWVTPV